LKVYNTGLNYGEAILNIDLQNLPHASQLDNDPGIQC
jgi:hypothetical protein